MDALLTGAALVALAWAGLRLRRRVLRLDADHSAACRADLAQREGRGAQGAERDIAQALEKFTDAANRAADSMAARRRRRP